MYGTIIYVDIDIDIDICTICYMYGNEHKNMMP